VVELGGFELVRDRCTAVLTEVARLGGQAVWIRMSPTSDLSEARAALELVEQGHATGKVVLIP
jgi:NADPH2:quinone reductase